MQIGGRVGHYPFLGDMGQVAKPIRSVILILESKNLGVAMAEKSIADIIKELESSGRVPASVEDLIDQVTGQMERVKERLARITHKMTIVSGKGGVGKSSVTVNLGLAFAKRGLKVGILDADISGPSIPKMLGLGGKRLEITPKGAKPAVSHLGIKVASMDLMLKKDNDPVAWKGSWQDSAVWRGALEMGVIRELLSDVIWGDLDILLIDMPPASSDKPPIIAHLIPDLDGAIMVTIPSEVSRHIVRKSISFSSRELKMPIIGLITNMTAFLCSECGHRSALFGEEAIADMGISSLGEIPFDTRISRSGDIGSPFILEFPESPASISILSIADRIIDQISIRRNG